MTLEIDNMIRSIEDIRKALLSVEPKATKTNEIIKIAEIKELTNEMEFKVRGLEFELNG